MTDSSSNQPSTEIAHPANSAELQTNVVSDASQLSLPDIPPPPEDRLPSLMSIRQQQKRTPEEVAASLRLSVAQIHALEAQRWSDLPGAAYIKGFLRNYARFLGVDAELYLAQYQAHLSPAPSAVQTNSHAHVKPNALPRPAELAAIPDDPAALSSFSHNSESQSIRKGLSAVVFALVLATIAFLLFWERAQWLPVVQGYWQKASHAVSGFTGASAGTGAEKPAPSKAADAPAVQSGATSTPSASPASPAADSNADASANKAIVPSATAIESVAKPNNDAVSTNAATVKAVTTLPANVANELMDKKTDDKKLDEKKVDDKKIEDKVKPIEQRKPATGPVRAIVVDVSKDVWLEVRDSADNVLNYGNKVAGSKQIIKGAAPLSIVIGAADAVAMSVDGKPYDVKAQSQGNVARFKVQ